MSLKTAGEAKDLADRRWERERTAALDRYVDQIVKRAGALTDEQRARILAAVRPQT